LQVGGGVISQIYITDDCTSSIPLGSFSSALKEALISCIGESSCEIPAQDFQVPEKERGAPVVVALCTGNPALSLDVEVGSNSMAHVHLNKLNLQNPTISQNGVAVWSNGQLVSDLPSGILAAHEIVEQNSVVVQVGSGQYNFMVSSEQVGNLICGVSSENQDLVLSCPANTKVSSVAFASFGTPVIEGIQENASCKFNFALGATHTGSTVAVVEDICVGKATCTLNTSPETFGTNTAGTLAVSVYCS